MSITSKITASILAAGLMAGAAAAGQLTVEMNKTKPVNLRGDIGSVVLGNPDVADVTVSDSNTLFVTGKTFGTTNIIAYNVDGNQIYSADLVVTTNAANLVSISRGGDTQIIDCSPSCSKVLNGGE